MDILLPHPENINGENILNVESDFCSELDSQQKNEINQGIRELDSGKRISFKDFLNKIS